jgi:amino-acid N-acetyltransferase
MLISMIRTATVRDVPAIARLINHYAERGRMLFRSHAELYEAIRDFQVYEQPGAGPRGPEVVGVAALEIVWSDLCEIRSLAVDEQHQKKGIGRALVEAVVAEAQRLEIARVFALTYEERFFARLGFHIIDRAGLPLKVWSTCIKCPKRDACDEIAMIRMLPGVAPIRAAAEEEQPHYEVPPPIVRLQVTKRA